MEKKFKVGDKVKIIPSQRYKNYAINVIHINHENFGHYKGTCDDIITILEIGEHNAFKNIVIYGIYGDNKKCCFSIEALELYESTEHYEIY